MIGRKKVEKIPDDTPRKQNPDAVGKGSGDEFNRQPEESAQDQSARKDSDDLKPGAQPDGTASGVGPQPSREPGIEETDETDRSSPID